MQLRFSILLSLAVAAAGCDEDESTDSTIDVADTGDTNSEGLTDISDDLDAADLLNDTGEDVLPDVVPDVEDIPAELDTDADDTADVDNDTDVDDVLPDVPPDADVTDDVAPDSDETDAADAIDDVELCLSACPDGCPAPDLQICGEDGLTYCNTCVMDCFGVVRATDDSVCDAPGCFDGDTRTEACNTCVCESGEWSCTERDCEVIDACLIGCGIGCPAPEFWTCASDGDTYCNECIIGCYGLTVAEPEVCMDCPPPDGNPISWTNFPLPDGCFELDALGGDALIESELEFAEAFPCAGGAASGIDFDSNRLFVGVVYDNPSGEVEGVYATDAGLLVHLVAPVYCGGARPPNRMFPVLLPAGTSIVTSQVCLEGECTGGPFP